MVERMTESPNKKVRSLALENIAASAEARAARATLALAPMLMASASPKGTKDRLIYDAKKRWNLPGKLVRAEGDPKTGDPAADEAYNYSGYTYDFYHKLFGRNSLDDKGMSLRSTVHYRTTYNNAFWNGSQMAYGDGDGIIFRRFTRSLDVVGHELTHGVVTFTANLEYHDEPGALNEHFSDVFGVSIRQWRKKQTAKQASWLIGEEILVPAPTRRAIRDMANPGKAYENDPDLGSDPQPAHIDDKYTGTADNGGVHINSGIPNHAFYVTATEIGGHAWEKAGRIWYNTLVEHLTPTSDFAKCARDTFLEAGNLYGLNSREQKAVKKGWAEVGITV